VSWRHVVYAATRLSNPDPIIRVRGSRRNHYNYRLGDLLDANLQGFRLHLGDVLELESRDWEVRAIGHEGFQPTVDLSEV